MADSPDVLHTTHIPVRWSDMDELGHVNNAVYFTYFEQARIEYFHRLAGGTTGGADASSNGEAAWPGAPESGPVLAGIEASFRKPVVYPATVIVRLFADEVGRTSLAFRNVLAVEGEEDTVYAEAHVTLVWIDRATGRPTPLPDALRQALPT